METNGNYDKERARGIAGGHDPAEALKKFRRPLFEYLVSGLDAEDKWVRVMSAGMLGTLGDPNAGRYLKPLVADHDADLRNVSKNSLMILHEDRTFPGTSLPDPCDTCMIRFIAEEALAYRKRSAPAAQQVPDTDC